MQVIILKDTSYSVYHITRNAFNRTIMCWSKSFSLPLTEIDYSDAGQNLWSNDAIRCIVAESRDNSAKQRKDSKRKHTDAMPLWECVCVLVCAMLEGISSHRLAFIFQALPDVWQSSTQLNLLPVLSGRLVAPPHQQRAFFFRNFTHNEFVSYCKDNAGTRFLYRTVPFLSGLMT